MKSGALLNESVGAGYIDRHWPPAFKDTGAWPLTSLRQSFLNGALTRLMDPDAVLRQRIVDFVANGEFGLASGDKGVDKFERVLFKEQVAADEVAYEAGVFLLTRATAERLRTPADDTKPARPDGQPGGSKGTKQSSALEVGETLVGFPIERGLKATLRLKGTVPPEVWNRLGTRILPKLLSGADLSVDVEFSVRVDERLVDDFQYELRQALTDLGLQETRVGGGFGRLIRLFVQPNSSGGPMWDR